MQSGVKRNVHLSSSLFVCGILGLFSSYKLAGQSTHCPHLVWASHVDGTGQTAGEADRVVYWVCAYTVNLWTSDPNQSFSLLCKSSALVWMLDQFWPSPIRFHVIKLAGVRLVIKHLSRSHDFEWHQCYIGCPCWLRWLQLVLSRWGFLMWGCWQ